MPEIMNNKFLEIDELLKEISDNILEEISNEPPEEKLWLRNKKFKRSQEALFDLIIGNFENRQSATTNYKMNHQVYCCVKSGNRSKSKSKSNNLGDLSSKMHRLLLFSKFILSLLRDVFIIFLYLIKRMF